MIKKIVLSVVIGLGVTLFYAQYDPWMQEACLSLVSNYLAQESRCLVSCRLKRINFFSPEIVLYRVRVSPSSSCASCDDWQWEADMLSISFSWWHFIKDRSINLLVTIHGGVINTTVVDKRPAIISYINRLFSTSSPFPVVVLIKNIEFHKSSLQMHDQQGTFLSLFFSSVIKEMGGIFKTVVHCDSGSGGMGSKKIFSLGGGTGRINIPGYGMRHNSVQGDVDIGVILSHLPKSICFLKGRWGQGSGRFSLRSIDEKFVIDPLIVAHKDDGIAIDMNARCPFSYMWHVLYEGSSANGLQGNCSVNLKGDLGKKGVLNGQLVIEDIKYNNQLICSACHLSMHKKDCLIEGKLFAHVHDIEMGGTWYGDLDTGAGSGEVRNKRGFTIPMLSYWYSNADDMMVKMARDDQGNYTVEYQAAAHNVMTNEPFVLKGCFYKKDDRCTGEGFLCDYTYSGVGSLDVKPYIADFTCQNGAGTNLIALKSVAPDTWSSIISFECIRLLCQAVVGIDLQGKGKLILDSSYNSSRVTCKVHFDDGIVRLPHTYNFINTFDAQFDWEFDTRTLSMENFYCCMHSGMAECHKGKIQFGNDGKLSFIHIPLVFDRCLLNVRKNLFAMFSGFWLLHKNEQHEVALKGRIFIDRAQMNDALFSLSVPRTLFSKEGATIYPFYYNIPLSLGIETKHSIGIDTPLLQANASVALDFSGTIGNPVLGGAITIDSGSILLPYKPLHITKGNILFDSDSIFNPTILLQARNKIKKYMVTLYAHGLLDDHQITFDANPPLGEEQIMSLLLVGSPEESLNAMMPALIMNNIQMALFGSGSMKFLDNYFKRATLPFSINLVPSFTDQTGRGGLRGGIEITVNDRWRAFIQKNFSLSEDTRFELEYFLSDDIAIRAIRDEHRDIGAEVEMRWKF